MKKEERDEYFWDLLFARAINHAEEEAPEEPDPEETPLTAQEDERLLQLIQQCADENAARRRRMVKVRRAGRVAACLLLLVAALSGLVLSVEAFREPVVEFTLNIFRDHARFTSDSIQNIPGRTVYLPTWIPDEYYNMNVVTDNEAVLLIYYFGDDYDQNIIYYQYFAPNDVLIDTEDAEIQTLEDNGKEFTLIKKDGRLQLLGTMDEQQYQFFIIGELNEKTILKIAQSIEAQKEI